MSKKKNEKSSGAGRVLDVILTLALVGGIGYGCYYVAQNGSKIDQNSTYQVAQPQEEETVEETVPEDQVIFDSEEEPNSEVFSGDMILVNSVYGYQGGDGDLVSLYDVKTEHDSHSYGVRDSEVMVRRTTAEQLTAMFDAFFEATYDDNIVVQSGYRSKERQQELYDADLAATGLDYSELVAAPGHSEHQTGLCVDLGLYDGTDYDGTGVYAWINEHCYEYGFILRYPDDKTSVTEIQAEPWHYRYVGRPHAFYMMNNHLCLEEYMDLLKEHPYDGEHLVITDCDGKLYEVYSYKMDAEYDSTMVPVPSSLPYTVSGNNADGFIVTFENPDALKNAPEADAAPAEQPEGDADSDIAPDADSPEDTPAEALSTEADAPADASE